MLREILQEKSSIRDKFPFSTGIKPLSTLVLQDIFIITKINNPIQPPAIPNLKKNCYLLIVLLVLLFKHFSKSKTLQDLFEAEPRKEISHNTTQSNSIELLGIS